MYKVKLIDEQTLKIGAGDSEIYPISLSLMLEPTHPLIFRTMIRSSETTMSLRSVFIDGFG